MTGFLIAIIVLMVLGFAALAYFILRPQEQKGPDQSIIMMQQQLQDLRLTLDGKLNESTRQNQLQFTEAQRTMQTNYGQTQTIIKNVTEQLTKLEETNKQVVGFAAQMQSLENILKNPKQRGILGEYFLETLLKNVFAPNQYQLQYKFSDGEIVDAVIFVKDMIIPIDSKFSLENYNKILQETDPVRHEQLEKQFKLDVKNRIDETSKYIRPQEHTTDFAFMFIPSEGIYYDLLVNQIGAVKINTRDLIEYAFKEKHVIIVSPTSFYAYLQTVVQGFRMMQLEENTAEIRKNIDQLGRHLLAYDEYMQKVGNNLGTTVNMYNTAYKEYKKIDKDVLKITGNGGEIEPLVLDKPQIE